MMETQQKGDYRISRKTLIPTSLDKAWGFFSDPRNLAFITPPDMDFRIRSRLANGEFYEGMRIEYTVRPLAGIPMQWISEIKHLVERRQFVDEMIKGPYAHWVHRHEFNEVQGGVEMRDVVDYSLPFGILGRSMHRILVRSKLEHIFDYREKRIQFLFQ